MPNPRVSSHPFLDELIVALRLKNDHQLAIRMGLSFSTLSKIRNRRCNISATVLCRAHELAGIGFVDLRRLCVAAGHLEHAAFAAPDHAAPPA